MIHDQIRKLLRISQLVSGLFQSDLAILPLQGFIAKNNNRASSSPPSQLLYHPRCTPTSHGLQGRLRVEGAVAILACKGRCHGVLGRLDVHYASKQDI
jgi:hypothetical protein